MRPLHLRPAAIGLVFLGGSLGAGIREGLTLLFPAEGFPWTIFVINLSGAFLLGFLLEALSRRGADRGVRRVSRLLLGTGVLGGFTTYSTLATDTALLLGDQIGLGLLNAVGTVLAGAAMSWLGIALAGLLPPGKVEVL